jgi:hypothetical protein
MMRKSETYIFNSLGIIESLEHLSLESLIGDLGTDGNSPLYGFLDFAHDILELSRCLRGSANSGFSSIQSRNPKEPVSLLNVLDFDSANEVNLGDCF